jgi:hypothetical protein
MSTSQIFTIGTALRRAEDNGVPVEVLVEGQWLRGDIAGLDGDGLVLVTPERTQCVVRNAHISVVRILANLSFDDEAPGEPQATSYQSGSTTYDAPGAWEPTGAAGPAAAATPADTRAADDASTFRWASTHGSAVSEQGPIVSEADEDRLVLGATDDQGLALGAAHDDDALVLDAGDEGPLELGSSWQADELLAQEPLAEPTAAVTEVPVEEPRDASPDFTEAPEATEATEAAEAEVIELRPEPVATEEVAEPAAEQPVTAKETPDDLVSRLLAESMREAGIEPEQPATASTAPEPAPESSVGASDDTGEVPSELLHPEKESADDEPRIFALPAPSSVAPAAAPAAEHTPAPAATDTPAPEPAPAATPAAEPPAAEAPAAPAAAGDDWRSMLEGLRSEAAAPQSSPQNAQPEEKRRGRRLVMR